MYNKNLFASELCFFDTTNPATAVSNINTFIRRINMDGHIEDVRDMFVIPDISDAVTFTSNTAYIELR